LGERIAALVQTGQVPQAYTLLAPVLAERTPFRLLDRIGAAVGAGPLEAVNTFLDHIAAARTEGGWVVIASALGQQLDRDPAGAFARCRAFVIVADVWYATDILGERVPGPALVADFQPSLDMLASWREDANRWVRRTVGVSVHFWARRSRGAAEYVAQAEALLAFLEPMFEEWDMDTVKDMGWGLMTRFKANPPPWLLEPDEANPGVRYFVLRDLLDRATDDPEVVAAQAEVMRTGPVPAILDAQYPDGYWVKPGPGYAPKYRSTLWQILFLAQLGADGRDERVRRAVEHVFAHAQAKNDGFACNGRPSTTIHCLWGNVVRALLDLRYWGDERLDRAIDALARSITGEGYEWYRKGGVQAPGFVCSANYGLPCAWGAVRALRALNRVPATGRTPAVEAAVVASTDFLLSYDVARADYPHHERISSSWFKFGYPLGYVTDVLLNLEALSEAGYAKDSRLNETVEFVLSKQDEQGRWKMECSHNGKMWADVEKKGRPSKWVTLRALRVLKMTR